MPSPIGHALAGAAIAWLFEPGARTHAPPALDRPIDRPSAPTVLSSSRLALLCAALAIVPDSDLLYLPIHRTVTHSVTAALLVMIIAAGVTRWVTSRIQWRVALACGVAYGSHVLLDWLGADASRPYGIQALWPFTDRWFIAPWPIFPGTERRSPLSIRSMWINFKAAAAEIGIMGAVAVACWRLRRTAAVAQRPLKN